MVSWQSDALTDDVVIAGDVTAHLFASTTGSDADWVVKLIDVYPDSYAPDPKMASYQLMVSNDVLRGRFRRLRTPQPLRQIRSRSLSSTSTRKITNSSRDIGSGAGAE